MREKVLSALSLSLLSLLVFHLRMDISLINPTQVEWVWQADWATHYLGWLFFRHDAWHFPLGWIENYLAPGGSSVGLTDSIPLAAYFFKLFSPLLPDNFQYFSWWYVGSLFLQGFFAKRLLFHFLPEQNKWLRFLSASLFVVAPPLMWRNWHIALCSQWLLLWGLDIYLRQLRDSQSRYREAAVLVAVASCIHPYLLAMVLLLLFAILAQPVCGKGSRSSWKKPLLGFILINLLALFLLFTNGYFLFSGDKSYSGFSYYSANLLSFFHPHDLPVLLPNLPRGDGQYEGYAYLGLGNILLLFVSLFYLIRVKAYKFEKKYVPLLIVALCSFAYAISTKVTFGNFVLLDLKFLEKLLSPLTNSFRSSGRFIWLPYYLLLLWGLVSFFKSKIPYKKAIFILLFILQIIDLHRIIDYPRSPDIKIKRETLEKVLTDINLDSIKSLYAVDVDFSTDCNRKTENHLESWLYYPLLELAAKKHWKTNFGIASRLSSKRSEQLCLEGLEAAATLPEGSLVVINAIKAPAIARQYSYRDVCHWKESTLLCFSR